MIILWYESMQWAWIEKGGFEGDYYTMRSNPASLEKTKPRDIKKVHVAVQDDLY